MVLGTASAGRCPMSDELPRCRVGSMIPTKGRGTASATNERPSLGRWGNPTATLPAKCFDDSKVGVWESIGLRALALPRHHALRPGQRAYQLPRSIGESHSAFSNRWNTPIPPESAESRPSAQLFGIARKESRASSAPRGSGEFPVHR